MQANRSQDTGPEIRVRRELHRRGLRYFVHRRPVPTLRRTADILFPSVKVAILIDGCFWHGCPDHHTVAKTNAEFWAQKVARNRVRDDETRAVWERDGWLVLRYWEHHDPVDIAAHVQAEVDRRRK